MKKDSEVFWCLCNLNVKDLVVDVTTPDKRVINVCKIYSVYCYIIVLGPVTVGHKILLTLS